MYVDGGCHIGVTQKRDTSPRRLNYDSLGRKLALAALYGLMMTVVSSKREDSRQKHKFSHTKNVG